MAKSEVKIEATTFGVNVGQLQTLGDALKDPSYLMRQIGVKLLIEATRAFEMPQGLPGYPWKPRYPNQKPPIINIAGSLQDLNTGREPKDHRFQRRPALMDTKHLLKSVAKDAPGANRLMGTHVVQVGSVESYAGLMQWGGTSTQPVTDTAKKALAEWMKTLRGARRRVASYDRSKNDWVPAGTLEKPKKKAKKKTTKKAGKSGTPKKSKGGTQKKSKIPKTSGMGKGQEKLFKQKSNEINRAEKLGFLFKKDRLTTKVWSRPFFGVTPRADEEIRKLIENWVANYVNR